jgi:PAS domain S-box-containing protein
MAPLQRRMFVPYAALASSLALTAAITALGSHTVRARDHSRFENAVESTSDRVRSRLQTYVTALRAGAALLESDEGITRDRFRDFTAALALAEEFPGILGIGFSKRLDEDEASRASLHAALRDEYPEFRLWPESDAGERHAVLYLEPLGRHNRAALGYDMFSDPTRREAMERARDTGHPAASGRVTLVQELDEGKQAGFLIYVPVYAGATRPATTAERRARLLGFVYGPFRCDDLFEGLFGSERHPRVSFEVYDGPTATGTLLHVSPRDATHEPRFQEEVALDVAGRPWTLALASTRELDRTSAAPFMALIPIAGAAISALLFLTTRAQVRSRVAAEQAAEEARAAEEALRAGEAQLRIITDTVPALISYIAPDERYLFNNEAYCHWFGRPPADLRGALLRDVLGASYDTFQPRVREALSGQTVTFEATVAHRALGQRVVRVTYAPDRAADGRVRGVVVLIVDETDQHEAERRIEELNRDLERQVAEFRALIDVIPIGIGVARDPGCQRIEHNPYYERMLPARPADARFLVDGRDVAVEALPMQRAAATGSALEQELEVWVGDLRRTLVAHAAPLLDERGAVGAFLDISERKRAEEAKDQFLAMLAHELRNPLAAIITSLGLLRMTGVDGARAARALEVIERQSRHLTRLVDDLLDVSRITRGKIELRRQPLDLRDVAQAAVADGRAAATAAGVELELEVAEAPLPVDGDPTRLAQVLSNLLSNAVKFSERGGRVRVVARADGDDAVQVTVRDQGIGITPELLPDLFRPFVQADRSLDRSRGGLGLGLAVVKGIVELHGGSVTATSAGPGRGAELALRLPRFAGAIPAAPAREGPSRQGPPARVLIIEDNRDAADTLSDALQALGHTALVANGGVEGLTLARESKPDIVLCDLGLPGMDGFAVARALRAEDATRDLVLVALTGYGREEDRARARAAGFDAHLAKPVGLDDIERLIDNRDEARAGRR